MSSSRDTKYYWLSCSKSARFLVFTLNLEKTLRSLIFVCFNIGNSVVTICIHIVVLKNAYSENASNLAGMYLLKVNNRNTKTKCEIYSKLTIKTPE